ncbi:MAG: eCIS core domain-containing protein [Thermodesulfobacteriota bacterium]
MFLALAKKPSHDKAHKHKSGVVRNSSITSQSTNPPLSLTTIHRKPSCPCGGGCPRCKDTHIIQTKLKFNEPGDKYEQEADRMADEIMRMPDSEVCDISQGHMDIQRKCAGCTSGEELCPECEQEKNGFVQRNVRDDSEANDTNVYDEFVVNPGPGQPLDSTSRAFFEPRFGHDFSRVRVHTHTRAAESARSVNALAYTMGRNIVFGAGQYTPETKHGKQLVAHELTHVIQQRKSCLNPVLQRQAVAVPNFRDCTPAITGIADANERLEAARLRAREFIGAARRRLAAAPAPGTTYAAALNRHFIAPTAADRATIDANYSQILLSLRVPNYICNSENICEGEQAFHLSDDDLIHVCRPFWPIGITCRGIILIHEGAHDVGLGIGAHPPNRGSANYPAGNVAPPVGETTAGRINNPDAYGFFAAHIWRDTDTGVTCF